MKIVFNGVFEKRTKGCNCKRQGNSEYAFITQKMYILPSGATKTFVVGKVEEVSAQDAQFLLRYIDNDANGTREVFSRAD